MLTIRHDQLTLLANAALSRHRRNAVQALSEEHPTWTGIEELVSLWFDRLAASGMAKETHFVHALELLRSHEPESKDIAQRALPRVLLRRRQAPEGRIAFVKRHLVSRLSR